MALFFITPMLGVSWPSLFPLIIAAAAGYGYKQLTDPEKGWLRGKLTREMEQLRRIQIPVEAIVEEAVGEVVNRDERLVFEKDDYRLIFKRDAKNRFAVEVLGPRDTPAAVLEREARAFVEELTQQFVYHRLTVEMEARGLNVVQEEIDAEGDIVLDLKRYR